VKEKYEKEIWKIIEDFPNYEVSNMGRVKSLRKWRGISNRILKPYKMDNGYHQIKICKNGRKYSKYIHILIFENFEAESIKKIDNEIKIRNLDGECWKIVRDFPNYMISNMGRIKRIKYGRGTTIGKILTPCISNEYLNIRISKNGKQYTKKIHRLVLENFNPVENMDKLQCNHINGVKTDNRLENLEWTTQSGNMKHAYKTGLMDQKGEKNNASKIIKEDVIIIRKLANEGSLTQKEIARLFKVTQQTISDIKNKKSWN